MAVVHLAAFIIGSIVILALPRKQRSAIGRRIFRFGLFMLLLLLVGAVFNGFWSCLIWDRLYDSTDYYFDFCPFWPITQAVIDAPLGNERGQLLGVTLFQLQLVWFIFAAGTWAATILVYRIVCKRLPPHDNCESTSGIAVVEKQLAQLK